MFQRSLSLLAGFLGQQQKSKVARFVDMTLIQALSHKFQWYTLLYKQSASRFLLLIGVTSSAALKNYDLIIIIFFFASKTELSSL